MLDQFPPASSGQKPSLGYISIQGWVCSRNWMNYALNELARDFWNNYHVNIFFKLIYEYMLEGSVKTHGSLEA